MSFESVRGDPFYGFWCKAQIGRRPKRVDASSVLSVGFSVHQRPAVRLLASDLQERHPRDIMLLKNSMHWRE